MNDYTKFDKLVDDMSETEAKEALKREARMRTALARQMTGYNEEGEQTEGKLRLLSMVGN